MFIIEVNRDWLPPDTSEVANNQLPIGYYYSTSLWPANA
jgi:hypothetical protein